MKSLDTIRLATIRRRLVQLSSLSTARYLRWPMLQNGCAATSMVLCQSSRSYFQSVPKKSGLFLIAVLLLSGGLSASTQEPAGTRDYENGLRLFSEGKLREARDLLLRAVSGTASDPRLYPLLGQVLLKTEEASLGSQLLQEGARRYPGNAEILSTLGHLCLAEGRLAEAIGVYQQAFDLSRDSRDSARNLAFAYYRKGLEDYRARKYLDSLAAAKLGIRLAPENSELHHLFAIASFALGQQSDALQGFERALQIEPDNPNYCYDFAVFNLSRGKSEDAKSLLEKTVRLKSDFPMAHLFLGRIYHNEKRTEEALEVFEKARKLAPELTGLHYHIGFSYKALGQDDRAIQEMEEEIRLHPDFLEARVELGDIYLRVGKPEAAISQLRYALQKEPARARAHFLLGKALAENGEDEAAIPELQEASRLSPNMAEPHYVLMQVYLKQQQTEAAQQQLSLFQQKKKVPK